MYFTTDFCGVYAKLWVLQGAELISNYYLDTVLHFIFIFTFNMNTIEIGQIKRPIIK